MSTEQSVFVYLFGVLVMWVALSGEKIAGGIPGRLAVYFLWPIVIPAALVRIITKYAEEI